MGKTPWQRAQQLVAGIAPIWGRIAEGNIILRRELLEVLCLDVCPNGRQLLKPGLPGVYLFSCARSGDKVAYDLLRAIGVELDFGRPKKREGIDANATRDFVVHILSKILQDEHSELCEGANDATPGGTSAIDLIRKGIEAAGLGCIDYRAPIGSAPVPRSMERAVKRFREKDKYRELFWPECKDSDSCHTQSGAVLRSGVCTETPSYGGTNDQLGTPTLGCAAHNPVALAPVCPDERGQIP